MAASEAHGRGYDRQPGIAMELLPAPSAENALLDTGLSFETGGTAEGGRGHQAAKGIFGHSPRIALPRRLGRDDPESHTRRFPKGCLVKIGCRQPRQILKAERIH